MTRKQALKLLKILEAAYPRQQITRDTIFVYAGLLSDLNFDAAQRVILRIIAMSPFFPTVSQIRAAYAEETLGLPTVEEALAEIRGWARASIGTWQWSHPLVRQVRDIIGEWNLRHTDNPAVTDAAVRRAYEDLRNRAIREVQVRPVMRLAEAGMPLLSETTDSNVIPMRGGA